MVVFSQTFIVYFTVYNYQLCFAANFENIQGRYVELNQNDVYETKVGLNKMGEEKVKVDLLYEALCPFCMQEYPTNLLPGIEQLGSYITLNTLPYGNARMHENDGKVTIQCQHGEKECYGNKLHACAIEILKDTLTYVKFNACLMPLHSNDAAADQCGKQQQVDSEAIKSCARSDMGFQLLKHYGKLSEKFNYDGVPTLFFNGKESGYNDNVKTNVCQLLKNPPPQCAKKMKNENEKNIDSLCYKSKSQ